MKKKYKIGLAFGAFDVFHDGHSNLLKNAKKICDKLIVCISTDGYILHVKGHLPAIPSKYRKLTVEVQLSVDEVGIQSLSFTKKCAVRKYRPDVLIVGNDWDPKTYTGEGLASL